MYDCSVPLHFSFSTHILTRRMTFLCRYFTTFLCFSTHILTWRMTFLSDTTFFYIMLFNSHPHKEDDLLRNIVTGIYVFSTHILTRRMTWTECIRTREVGFSTHILTRRMTGMLLQYLQTVEFSTHILTWRMTVSVQSITSGYLLFNSHPHKEDDNYLP